MYFDPKCRVGVSAVSLTHSILSVALLVVSISLLIDSLSEFSSATDRHLKLGIERNLLLILSWSLVESYGFRLCSLFRWSLR